ncbi:MAG: hypothetical protein LBI12_05560 [Treponema sp.]|jgi:hypothetical protein|nr:hypothetical protein [Treponema sp.]
MRIENVKIEDAADANYVIRKFFKNELKSIKLSQLEQLILTVYNMGKNNGLSADSEDVALGSLSNLKENDTAKANPFKINDRAKAIEDIEIGNSGEFVQKNAVGTVTAIEGDVVSFLFEMDDEGEMIEASVLFDKLEKI